jgi:hypothetical protein
MYKSRVRSMQRGAARRNSEVMSVEELHLYGVSEPFLTEAEQRHFGLGTAERYSLLDRLEPLVRNYAKSGFRKPRDVARLLNKASITTARGSQWTRRLAFFLLKDLFDEKIRRERLDYTRRHSSDLLKKAKSSGVAPSISLGIAGKPPLTSKEIAKRLAVIMRIPQPK